MRNSILKAVVFMFCMTDSVLVAAEQKAPLRIMCVGDSITAGYTDNPKWDVPFEFGYRQGLFERLQKAGYQFQFVGDSPEPWDGRFGVPKNSPLPDLRAIGQDRHEGHGGWNRTSFATHRPVDCQKPTGHRSPDDRNQRWRQATSGGEPQRN